MFVRLFSCLHSYKWCAKVCQSVKNMTKTDKKGQEALTPCPFSYEKRMCLLNRELDFQSSSLAFGESQTQAFAHVCFTLT